MKKTELALVNREIEVTSEEKIQTLEKQLLALAVAVNNTVMTGSFSGDNITSAADLMSICRRIVRGLDNG